MSKLDKRENMIMIASEPLTFEKGMSVLAIVNMRSDNLRFYFFVELSGLDGDQDQHTDRHYTADEPLGTLSVETISPI